MSWTGPGSNSSNSCSSLEADIQSLSDDLFKYARHNFPNTMVMQVTKESAKQFKENSFPASRSNLSFHLQSIVANFVSWKHTDPRVTKEVFKCKILASAVRSCFSIQRTKSDARQRQRMIISFPDILGLEVSDDSIVMDVREIPTMERKIISSTQPDRQVTHQKEDVSSPPSICHETQCQRPNHYSAEENVWKNFIFEGS